MAFPRPMNPQQRCYDLQNYDVACLTCGLHRITTDVPQICSKCGSLQLNVMPAQGMPILTR
jgi:Zn finger protein HypA/HybF involved in hydrogenase expression